MPDYDAFGREIGEDPLTHLRSATNPAPAPARAEPVEAEPVAQPVVAAPEPERIATPRIEFVRPRRRRGGLAGLLVVAAVIGGLALATNAVVEEGQDIIDRIQPEIVEPEPAPTGLQARSLIRRDNLDGALKQLADSGLGRPMTIRIAPDRVDATLLGGGQVHVVQITADGELRDFGANPGKGPVMAFERIDAAAPEKLVRRGATRRFPPGSISYVLITPGEQMAVNAYFEGGRVVLGDRHGRPQRVL